jgi:MFS family permease
MPRLFEPLRDKNFRWFWFGGTISVFGDHFTFIALPWLVLELTGDPLAMGTVLALAAIPRAVFMLFGGAVSDLWSPRLVMLTSNLLRFFLVAALAALTYLDAIDLPLILVIAFLFGVADAFLFPAASAMPPRLLEKDQLAAGNGLLQGSFQLTVVVGPLAAGLLIAALGDTSPQEQGLTDRTALATVFAIDATTFLASLWALFKIRERFIPQPSSHASFVGSILEGLRWAWQDRPIRTFMMLSAALSLVFRGPFMVGVPALANAHLPQGAAAYGIIVSALGVGSIIGAIIAGSRKPLPYHWLGKLMLIDFMLFGAIMILMANVHELAIITSVVLVVAILDGYLIVFFTTWLQQHVPAERLARVMSVVMFVSQGLFPISAAAAGAMAGRDLLLMLMLGGALAVATSLIGFSFRQVRRLGFD